MGRSIGLALIYIISVSYTHLRMVNRYSKNQNILPSIFPARGPTASDRIKATATEAVSYTHLDVYKRQIWSGILLPTLTAAAFAALYAELLAWFMGAPATLFLIPALLIPLVPGRPLYYAMY